MGSDHQSTELRARVLRRVRYITCRFLEGALDRPQSAPAGPFRNLGTLLKAVSEPEEATPVQASYAGAGNNERRGLLLLPIRFAGDLAQAA